MPLAASSSPPPLIVLTHLTYDATASRRFSNLHTWLYTHLACLWVLPVASCLPHLLRPLHLVFCLPAVCVCVRPMIYQATAALTALSSATAVAPPGVEGGGAGREAALERLKALLPLEGVPVETLAMLPDRILVCGRTCV